MLESADPKRLPLYGNYAKQPHILATEFFHGSVDR